MYIPQHHGIAPDFNYNPTNKVRGKKMLFDFEVHKSLSSKHNDYSGLPRRPCFLSKKTMITEMKDFNGSAINNFVSQRSKRTDLVYK